MTEEKLQAIERELDDSQYDEAWDWAIKYGPALIAALRESQLDVLTLQQQLASMSSATTQEQKELLGEIAALKDAHAEELRGARYVAEMAALVEKQTQTLLERRDAEIAELKRRVAEMEEEKKNHDCLAWVTD